MARIKTKQVQGVGRITLEYAIDQFMRHNRLKNLSPRTIEYYTEDLRYFQKITEVTYLDEITDKLYEDFILHEMDKGNKMTAVNCRTRGLRVFLRFCAKREYLSATDCALFPYGVCSGGLKAAAAVANDRRRYKPSVRYPFLPA